MPRNPQRRAITLKVVPPQKRSIWKKLLVVVGALGVIFGVIKGGIEAYEKLSPAPPPAAADVIVNHFWDYSPVPEPRLHSTPASFEWQVAFSITNLESKPVALVDLEPQFVPVEINGHVWQVNEKGGSLVSGTAFESEAALHERTVNREDWEAAHPNEKYALELQPPFLVKPGETRYFLFLLVLPLFRDGAMCNSDECTFTFTDKIAFSTLLLGGWIDHTGKVWCIKKDIPFKIQLDNGRVLQQDLNAFIGVPGCQAPKLRISNGEVQIEPIPD